jgi:hypothetical protein
VPATPPPVAVVPPTPTTPTTEKPAFIATTSEVTDPKIATNTTTAAAPNVSPAATPTPLSEPSKGQTKRPGFTSRRSGDGTTTGGTGTKGPLNDIKSNAGAGGRRGSWISNFSSKFSSSPASTPRSASLDAQSKPTTPTQASPGVEFANPFDKKEKPDPKTGKEEKKKEEKKVVVTHTVPRRQSVLVHAGQERKESNPGFLSSALRRLSSSNSASLGKAANSGAICPRKVMNIDQNRDRVKIADFHQNELKRVAFCVDVEIAGYAQHAYEESAEPATYLVVPGSQRQSLAQGKQKKDAKEAKYKEKGEGAALKNPKTATEEKEETGTTKVDIEAAEAAKESKKADEDLSQEGSSQDATAQEGSAEPTTRKKEKKKRSEAERKERREKKRRRAEENGEVPLELSGKNCDDSDDSPGSNGSSTPSSDQPTTDPLRIYKRCCQLRETTALKVVMDQISRQPKTLSETPGTVAVLDLSGTELPFEDIVTLSDWLAVVPMRKLMMDDCGLTDEGVRIILSGLVGCKSAEQAKQNKKLPKRGSGKRGQEQLGVVEKISLKNNQFTALGWKHICLFLLMSRSIRAIDLSGNALPGPAAASTPGSLTKSNTTSSNGSTSSVDCGGLLLRALTQRFGDKLEELILSNCSLTTNDIANVMECASRCKIKRIGLAENNLGQEALEHIGRYLRMGFCEGLDLGSNDLHNQAKLIFDKMESTNSCFALSLSDCNLTPSDLNSIFPILADLHNFRFLDLSHNQGLFSSNPNAVPILRKFLPKMTVLRRIHLTNVGMSSDDLIAIAEILPECPALAHVNVIENHRLTQVMNAKDEASQEEACALFASLMVAARVSKTMVAIEIEVPSADSSEVVKALASQVVAYTLRNMERDALNDYGLPETNTLPEKDAPEVLLHLVGHMEGYSENHDNDEPAPDEDYMIASTGVVKALRVFLATDHPSRDGSRNLSPTASGTATPKQSDTPPLRPSTQKKPKDVSLELCESARKIRIRLRPALIKEDREGNDLNYRKCTPRPMMGAFLSNKALIGRLQFLDSTLERIILRFEQEYPEMKLDPLPSPPDRRNVFDFHQPLGSSPLGPSPTNVSQLSGSVDSNGTSHTLSPEEAVDAELEDNDPHAVHLARNGSNASLAAKAQIQEEGQMHRFGQQFRRELMRPTGMLGYEHGTTREGGPEPARVAKLRARLEEYPGEAYRKDVEEKGVDRAIKELGYNMEELRMLEEQDPEGFETFRQAQLAAELNVKQARSGAASDIPSIYAET